MGSEALDLEVLPFSDDAEIALQIGKRVHQRRRIEKNVANEPAVVLIAGCTEAEAKAGVTGSGRRTFDQAEHGGVWNTRLGVGEICPPQADLPQQFVSRRATPTQFIDDKYGRPGGNFRDSRHDVPSERWALLGRRR